MFNKFQLEVRSLHEKKKIPYCILVLVLYSTGNNNLQFSIFYIMEIYCKNKI